MEKSVEVRVLFRPLLPEAIEMFVIVLKMRA